LSEQARVAERVVLDVPVGERHWFATGAGDERHLTPERWKELAGEAGLRCAYEENREISEGGRVVRWFGVFECG